MFKWYGKADVCFAYLQYFDNPSAPEYESFARVRWFTRGRTLQELISPRRVQFFGPGWVFIGTRGSLFQEIARITGIDEDILSGRGDINSFSIAQRMSWASHRIKTREEDIAYYLLVIFGVHIPLVYGEGSNAFIRLQEEIMKDSVDQSLFALERLPDEAAEFYPDLYRGILARSPLEFWNAALIIHYPDPGEPYMMTNKGLRIQLAVKRRHDGCLRAVSDCHYENNLTGPTGVVLKPNHDNALHGTALLFHASERPVVLSREEVKSAQSFVFYLSKHDESYAGTGSIQNAGYDIYQMASNLWKEYLPLFERCPTKFQGRCFGICKEGRWNCLFAGLVPQLYDFPPPPNKTLCSPCK